MHLKSMVLCRTDVDLEMAIILAKKNVKKNCNCKINHSLFFAITFYHVTSSQLLANP